jgi:hypothetical protein
MFVHLVQQSLGFMVLVHAMLPLLTVRLNQAQLVQLVLQDSQLTGVMEFVIQIFRIVKLRQELLVRLVNQGSGRIQVCAQLAQTQTVGHVILEMCVLAALLAGLLTQELVLRIQPAVLWANGLILEFAHLVQTQTA